MANSSQPEVMTGLLTTKEAAKVLGISKDTLIRWRYEGVGPDYYKMERLVRYDRGELERYKQRTLVSSPVRAHMEDNSVSL